MTRCLFYKKPGPKVKWFDPGLFISVEFYCKQTAGNGPKYESVNHLHQVSGSSDSNSLVQKPRQNSKLLKNPASLNSQYAVLKNHHKDSLLFFQNSKGRTMIKKKKKFSSYLRKFRWDRL